MKNKQKMFPNLFFSNTLEFSHVERETFLTKRLKKTPMQNLQIKIFILKYDFSVPILSISKVKNG